LLNVAVDDGFRSGECLANGIDHVGKFLFKDLRLDGKKSSSIEVININGQELQVLIGRKYLIEGNKFLEVDVVGIFGEKGEDEGEEGGLEDQRVADLLVELLGVGRDKGFLLYNGG
jgi:hypothetical protein